MKIALKHSGYLFFFFVHLSHSANVSQNQKLRKLEKKKRKKKKKREKERERERERREREAAHLVGEDARVKTTAREHTQKSCQRERLVEELVLPLRSKKFPSSSRIRKQNGKRVQQWKQERKR